MIFADAHVHIYDCFSLPALFQSALINFRTEIKKIHNDNTLTGILFLAETEKKNWFKHLLEYTHKNTRQFEKTLDPWTIYQTKEKNSLYARFNENQGFYIIAGHQLLSSEGLEMLALSCLERFSKKKPIKELIDIVRDRGAIPVIPWGAGKWIGKRGNVLKKLISQNSDSLNFFLGDNGGRPFFWRHPSHLRIGERRGIQNLPGSDPLPFNDEIRRIGSFGFAVEGVIDPDFPASSIKKILFNPANKIRPYGKPERTYPFFRKQLALWRTR